MEKEIIITEKDILIGLDDALSMSLTNDKFREISSDIYQVIIKHEGVKYER